MKLEDLYYHEYLPPIKDSKFVFEYLDLLKKLLKEQPKEKPYVVHHIVARELLKSLSPKEQDFNNTIKVSYKDHYILHRNLAWGFDDPGLRNAFFLMSHQGKYKQFVDAEEYERLQLLHWYDSLGEGNPMYGYKFSEESLKRYSENAKNFWSNSENRKHHSEAIKGEKNGRYGKICYTNGEKNLILSEEEEVPEGFYKGMTQNRSKTPPCKKGFSIYTDGKINLYLYPGELIPKGFYKGITRKNADFSGDKNPCYGKRGYTNGEINIFCKEGEQPEGFYLGITNNSPKTRAFTNGKINIRLGKEETPPEGFWSGITLSQDRTGKWYNNGKENLFVPSGSTPPEGFFKGRLNNFSAKGTIWINNGKINKRVPRDSEIPEGFFPGALPRSEEFKKKIFITNGKENKRILPSELREYEEKGYRKGMKQNEKFSIIINKELNYDI